MTYNDRNEILQNSEYVGKIRIAICDWVNYWATNGTSSIDNPELKELTDTFIKFYLSNPEAYTLKLAILAISESVIKDAVEVTDNNIEAAVTHLMSSAISYLI